jgi:hypothetical protein|tara:strand:+ start:6362 stop:7168 length:807 start_codon:yes stop_codon:yes gene_type:complete
MSTTTKAAPKAAQKKTPEPKKGYSVIKKDAAPDTTKVFSINRGGGIVTKIKSEASVYDPETNLVRGIRYCPGEPSIFRDEQNQNSRREHILFRDGLLAVPYNKPNLAKFLELHPNNSANGGKLFKLLDNSRDSQEEVNSEFLTHDAVSLVRTKGSDEILAVALSLNINIEQKMIDIRREMLREAKSSPAAFIAMFDDPRVKTRSAVIQATDFQIISCKNDGIYWFDSGRLIISVPQGQDPKDIMVRFCLTEKGASVYEELVNRLEKLS